MRKISYYLLAIAVTVLALFACKQKLSSEVTGRAKSEVVVFNWGDYIDPSLIKQFEKEYGYHVVYETFDSNESMITKIRQGGTHYDVAVPSEYKVPEMAKANLLRPIDYSKIKGMQYIDKRFLDMPFDPKNKYSIPYFWGTLGIVYNSKQLGEGAIKRWADLWKPEYKDSILMIDGAREMLGIGLQRRGYSLNECNSEILDRVEGDLKGLMTNIKALLADEMKMYMIQGEAPIAVTFSGEAGVMLEENPDLRYVIPEEGTNIWVDNLVIPKSAKNIQGAHDFISFLMRPEVAAQNARYITYSTPNTAALKLLPKSITEDKNSYPDAEAIKRMEIYKNIGKKKTIEYNERFLEIKMH
ncbi:extracellular solute-binding protein [Atopobacter sp. AH10]|uniref:ABC transporter substrate-binding protein n=1 Tax=Atopobacter sp. AH10 TaxID=2315861 RepID=UPI000EF1C153|nr:ABC transporter substrate-binding protein [Atopobacter sp. AH10]RLK63893.1 extracellular solute-binding protein [Atopobacter sp. AH10]